jgi:large subunit ribosomal protein L18
VKKLLEKLEKLVNKIFIKRNNMKKKIKKLYLQNKKRSLKKIIGTENKPRLAVFRSHNHIYAQLIDDTNGRTLTSSSTLSKELNGSFESTSNQAAALLVGENLAIKALNKEISLVVFDRGDRPYHGRIQKLAEGARNKGLIF